MTSVVDVIGNKGLCLGATDCYAAILGESPSKGARSPALWNAAFRELHLSGFMHPMDVAPDRLKEVVACLRADKRFIGGAVTMPYKIDILPFLDALEPEAELVGAVNCLYRDGERLLGANTDGAGALWSLVQEAGPLAGKTAMLLGTGGAGFAVAAYVASELGPGGRLLLANRSPKPLAVIAERLRSFCRVECVPSWPIEPKDAVGVDIVINCSAVGFETVKKDDAGAFCLKFYTPLGRVDQDIRVPSGKHTAAEYLKAALDPITENYKQSWQVLGTMDNPFIFDIIYQPRQTLLLGLAGLLGCRTLNGLPMNLEQAVIAFDKATVAAGMRRTDMHAVRRIMREIG